MRRAHFDVEGILFDTARKAIVTIESGQDKSAAIIRVRAHRRPREAVMLLADVVQIVLERDAKALAAQNRTEREHPVRRKR